MISANQRTIKWTKIGLFITGLLPLCWILGLGLTDELGARPIEKLIHFTGDWGLRLLLITLAVTPMRRLLGWNSLIRYRRLLGLYCFFYVCLHFLSYFVLDQFFDWPAIIKDIVKRPYITVGFAGFVMLIPLAVTSTNRMMKRLGKRWQTLHQLVYVIGVCGIFHYLWLVKADILEPLVYACILLILLLSRVIYDRRKKLSLTLSQSMQ